MKVCRPKSLGSLSPEEITSASVITKFLMSAFDFYLAVISDCLIVAGYIFGKICCSEIRFNFMGSVLVLLGHLVAFIADVFIILNDLLYVKEYRRDFSINKYLVVANILSLIGQYQELKSALRTS